MYSMLKLFQWWIMMLKIIIVILHSNSLMTNDIQLTLRSVASIKLVTIANVVEIPQGRAMYECNIGPVHSIVLCSFRQEFLKRSLIFAVVKCVPHY